MQPIFRKELTKRAQLIYYHFTTIWAETGSFRSIRTVFSEKNFFTKETKNSSANLPPFCKFLLPFYFRAFLRLHKYSEKCIKQ